MGRRLPLLATVATAAVLAAGCGGGSEDNGGGSGDSAAGALGAASFTVGSKEFTEQLVLGHITKLALEHAGAKVKDQIGLQGTAAARTALTSGDIDMYWEYTGTGWITHLKETKPIADAQEQYEAVAEKDLAQNKIKWLKQAPMDNTYGFAVAKEKADELGVKTISDLARLAKEKPDELTMCVASEFSTRDDGLPGVEKTYGFKVPKDKLALVDLGVVYNSVDKGKPCNFGEVFLTDGRIDALGLTTLEDDKSFFPRYNAALTVRQELYETYASELARVIGAIA